MDIIATAKDMLKRVYTKGVAMTQPGGALSFQYPPGYVNPDKYDTKLDVQQENQYKDWLNHRSRNTGRNIAMDNHDYDTRGYWKDNVGSHPTFGQYLRSTGKTGHSPDTYKKPNHPTFSNESKYSGQDGYEGGTWTKDTFTPSDEMKKRTSKKGLFKYFEKREPGTKLIWSDEPKK
jgi:hypothetical protein